MTHLWLSILYPQVFWWSLICLPFEKKKKHETPGVKHSTIIRFSDIKAVILYYLLILCSPTTKLLLSTLIPVQNLCLTANPVPEQCTRLVAWEKPTGCCCGWILENSLKGLLAKSDLLQISWFSFSLSKCLLQLCNRSANLDLFSLLDVIKFEHAETCVWDACYSENVSVLLRLWFIESSEMNRSWRAFLHRSTLTKRLPQWVLGPPAWSPQELWLLSRSDPGRLQPDRCLHTSRTLMWNCG